MRRKVDLQELAEFMRDAAYGDNQIHHINWALSVIHPKTNDGNIGYSGGMWNPGAFVSLSFSYSQSAGITDFRMWIDHNEIKYRFGGKPNFEEFKETIIGAFGIEKLYRAENKSD